jgi:hypothetical protein
VHGLAFAIEFDERKLVLFVGFGNKSGCNMYF